MATLTEELATELNNAVVWAELNASKPEIEAALVLNLDAWPRPKSSSYVYLFEDSELQLQPWLASLGAQAEPFATRAIAVLRSVSDPDSSYFNVGSPLDEGGGRRKRSLLGLVLGAALIAASHILA